MTKTSIAIQTDDAIVIIPKHKEENIIENNKEVKLNFIEPSIIKSCDTHYEEYYKKIIEKCENRNYFHNKIILKNAFIAMLELLKPPSHNNIKLLYFTDSFILQNTETLDEYNNRIYPYIRKEVHRRIKIIYNCLFDKQISNENIDILFKTFADVELTGLELTILCKLVNKKMFKLTNDKCIHRNVKYDYGLIIDPRRKEFDAFEEKTSGGIYFCLSHHIDKWKNNMVWIWDIEIPHFARTCIDSNISLKSTSLIFGNKKRIS